VILRIYQEVGKHLTSGIFSSKSYDQFSTLISLLLDSTVYFPVFVEGAKLSMGDMHFSQGDGEVSFCGAIEMSGFLDLRCSVIKGGMKMLPAVGPSKLNVNPIFEIGPLEPRYSEWLVFEGISVDEQGKQRK